MEHFMKLIIIPVFFLLVSFNLSLAYAEYFGIINKVKVTFKQENIDIDDINTKIEAQVYLASNDCKAEGLTAKLVHERVDNIIEVYALIEGRHKNELCPAVYKPVFVDLKTEFNYIRSKTSDIIILHYKDRNKAVSLFKKFRP